MFYVALLYTSVFYTHFIQFRLYEELVSISSQQTQVTLWTARLGHKETDIHCIAPKVYLEYLMFYHSQL